MSEGFKKDKILILDFGSQYTQLIARRIRECKVYCVIRKFDITIEEIEKFAPKGIILSGGPSSVFEEGAPLPHRNILDLGIPILGICYGMQLLALLSGYKVEPSPFREYGKTSLIVEDSEDLFRRFKKTEEIIVWMSHGDRIEAQSSNPKSQSNSKLKTQNSKLIPIARTQSCAIAAFKDPQRKLWGLQFHPEVYHTPRGKEIIENFLFWICQCSPSWEMEAFFETTVKGICEQVKDAQVLCALSGGIDSTVTALLVHRAVGNQLHPIFVDNGLLRKSEREKVVELFSNTFHMPLKVISAEERFLKKLNRVKEPEKKRKVIGKEFIRIFEEEAQKIKGVKFLAQGTLYPDVIESLPFKGPSSTIKSHHNVGGLPRKMNLDLIEPLRELFKDEVRTLARLLGIDEELIRRQPFPGPGLAIRIMGEVTKKRLEVLREVDYIVEEEIKKRGYDKDIWQSFAVLLPIKTVGVMGDQRTYENVVAIRAVTSLDGMTADWAKLPYDLLETLSSRIINEVSGINRVVYDISSKPPSTIEWE